MKIMDSIMSISFWIFYYCTLILIVWYVLQFNWGDISSLEVIKNIGIIGGLLYLGEFFKDEAIMFAKDSKLNKQEDK